DPAVPKTDTEEGVEEEDKACGEPRLGRGAVKRRTVRPYGEEFVPEAEIDAEIDERRPSHECGGGKDGAVVGCKNCGQENRQQPGDAEEHAVEQHAVLLLGLIGVGVPQMQTRD